MNAQISLTVPEGKRLIAKGISALPEVRRAMEDGMILLKGGTTVSALAEELAGIPLRISGRITERGTVAAARTVDGPHSLLLRRGRPEPADGHLEEIVSEMGSNDVVVCGANLIDANGNAAMMAGRFLGGEPGRVLPLLPSEGVMCIVAAGIEKLSPIPVTEAMRVCGRKKPGWSMGMAVGLVPLFGRLVTELEALRILGARDAWVIGRGGVDGASGGSTFIVDGDAEWFEAFRGVLLEIGGAGTSGLQGSLEECLRCGPNGAEHRACCYRDALRKENDR